MFHEIVADAREGIGDCIRMCPVECIHWASEPRHNAKGTLYVYIDGSECIDCGACLSLCPIEGAIDTRDPAWLGRWDAGTRLRTLVAYLAPRLGSSPDASARLRGWLELIDRVGEPVTGIEWERAPEVDRVDGDFDRLLNAARHWAARGQQEETPSDLALRAEVVLERWDRARG